MNPTQSSQNATSYGFGAELTVPIDEAIARAKEALKSEGFGVLTTIDVRQTLHDKLGVAFEPYVILGACNPSLAHRALQAEHDLGLLLPCNVIIYEREGRSTLSIVDPAQMLGMVGDNPALAAVADEASARLRRVVATLAGTPAESARLAAAAVGAAIGYDRPDVIGSP